MRGNVQERRRRSPIITLAAILLSALAIAARPSAAPDWSARLAALDPARPVDYFELAEEIADGATGESDKQLARHLFGLAGTLAPDTFGRSAALAQASLASDERQRRTLLALASLLDVSSGGSPVAAQRRRVVGTHAVALSEAFSHLRRGQGPRALTELKSPEVSALLDEYGLRLPGGPDRFRDDCRSYKGGVRPMLQRDHVLLMWEIEEAILSAAVPPSEERQLSWSTALVETNSRPLLEVDVHKLETMFGVDPSRPLWRKGQWETSH